MDGDPEAQDPLANADGEDADPIDDADEGVHEAAKEGLEKSKAGDGTPVVCQD